MEGAASVVIEGTNVSFQMSIAPPASDERFVDSHHRDALPPSPMTLTVQALDAHGNVQNQLPWSVSIDYAQIT